MTLRSIPSALVVAAALTFSGAALVGCDSNDSASDNMHDAGNNMKDAAQDAGNNIKDAAHDVKNDVKDATH